MILEYSPKGEIYRELLKRKRFSERRAASYISRIAAAMDYCHQKHVIHRDIKPENILIGYDVISVRSSHSVERAEDRRFWLVGALAVQPPSHHVRHFGLPAARDDRSQGLRLDRRQLVHRRADLRVFVRPSSLRIADEGHDVRAHPQAGPPLPLARERAGAGLHPQAARD